MKPLLKLIIFILALIACVSCQGGENETADPPVSNTQSYELAATPTQEAPNETTGNEIVSEGLPFVPAYDGPRSVSNFFLIGWAVPGVAKWSYDGSYLAVQKSVGRISPIYVIETADIDSWSNPHQAEIVAEFEGAEFNWSPIDNQLAFVQNNTLFLTSVESLEPIEIGYRLPLNTIPYFIADGNEIAFSAWGDGSWGIDGIDIESGTRRRVASHVNNWHWSFAARQLVYEYSNDKDDDTEIVVRDLNNAGDVFLTENSFCDVAPVWSPDGGKIAFVSDRNSHDDNWREDQDIFIVNLEDELETQVTNGKTINVQPSWSPDSEQIVFVNYDFPGEPPDEIPFIEIEDRPYWGEQDLFKYDLSEGRLIRLTSTSEAAEWLPVWSPDGDYIAYFTFDTSDGYVMDTTSWELRVIRSDGSGDHVLIDIK